MVSSDNLKEMVNPTTGSRELITMRLNLRDKGHHIMIKWSIKRKTLHSLSHIHPIHKHLNI